MLLARLAATALKAHVGGSQGSSTRPIRRGSRTTSRRTPAYEEGVAHPRGGASHELVDRLRGSVPFFSYRYQAHMLWDVTLPAVLGYLAAILYNQNNVAAEASPVTTQLEMEVGRDLCAHARVHGSAGRRRSRATASSVVPWGHITCDGSVANIESMWAARNLKYFPVALAAALATTPGSRPRRD